MKKYIAILFLQIMFIKCDAQSKIIINVQVIDSLVSCKKDNFSISYKIVNNTKRKLKIPEPIVLLNDPYVADLAYCVEKYNDSAKKFLPYKYILDEMAYREVKFTFIAPKKSVGDIISVVCMFSEPGIFRLRLKLFSSRFNKGLPDYYSNWVKFRVTESYVIK
jgi:hypothetical protein